MCGCQGFLGCEISFPSIDSRLKQVFVFFRPPELVNFRLKSLLETTFAQSKQICSFDDGDAHTCSIDLVGVSLRSMAVFWLGELSNKGGRGQRNREEIGTPLLRPARQNRHATQAKSEWNQHILPLKSRTRK